MFRQESRAVAEKPERRVLEARALFDMYKRSVRQEGTKFDVSDLVKMNEAFRENPTFENDQKWLRDQLASQYDNQSTESKLAVIAHLIHDDPQLANQLIDKGAESIKKDYLNRRQSANERDASMEKKQAAAKLEEALSLVVDRIAAPDRAEEIEKKLGYENPLDETLTDRQHNKLKVRIRHLRAPELKDIAQVPLENQWNELGTFLKQVEAPAQFLESWYGGNIDQRKYLLSERVNQAFKVGIELIKRMPPAKAGKRLLKLCELASTFARQLAHRDVWARRNGVSLPVGHIDDPRIFAVFIRERSKQERQDRRTERREKDELEEFNIDLEKQLAMVGIEYDMPELATDEMNRLSKRTKELSTSDFEQLYGALKKRAESVDHYRPLAGQFRDLYHGHLDRVMTNPSSKREAIVIETRLSEFLDPTTDWERTAKTIEAIKKSNAYKQHSGRTEYFPDALIEKSVQSLADLPEDRRKARLASLEDFVNQPLASERYGYESSKRFSFFADVLRQYGFVEEAAQYAGQKNLTRFIAKVLHEGDKISEETLWKTKGWEPTDVLSELISQTQQQGAPVLDSLLRLADRFRTSFTQIERDRYAAKDTEMIGKRLQELITASKSYNREYIPPFDAKELAAVQERIAQYRSLSWELWQQGQVPHEREVRQRVLKIFVEDGRDLAIAELGLSADQKIELFLATGKVAIDQKNPQASQQAIANAKRLKMYEQNGEARKLVTDLEKDQEMLILQTDVAKMNPERLRALLDQSKFDRDKILDALIDSGRYHEAITLCGELGQERIARQLIDKGAFEIAEELIRVAPSKLMPNRGLLLALISYRKAGGETTVEKPEQLNALVDELPALLRARGTTEAEILKTVREFLSDDQRLLIDRCVEAIGQNDFLDAKQSYDENSLKHFYLDVLINSGKKEEAIRFAVLHENGILTHLVRRLAEGDVGSEIEPLLYKVSDLDTMNEIIESLVNAGQKKPARNLVQKFIGSLTNESSVFKNILIERRDGSVHTANRASEEEQKKNVDGIKRLIFATGSLESLAHIRSLFKNEENTQRFVHPLFAGLSEGETSPRDLAKVLSALGSDGIEWYSSTLLELGASKKISSLVTAIEFLFSREEAMKRFPHIYAANIAASAKEAFVEDVRNLSSQARVQKFVDRYNPEDPKDTILAASISLDKQEWNKFVALLPPEERERASLLADWYAAPRVEEQNLGPVVERATSRLTQAIESSDLETVRLSLDTLLSARTPEAASKLTRVFLKHLEGGGRVGTTYELARTLSGMESFKANTVLSEVMAQPGTPDVLSRYIIRLLVKNGHLDPDLRGYFEDKKIADKAKDGEKLRGAVGRFRMLMQQYGINPDSAIMRYTDGKSNEEISANLERMIEQVTKLEEHGQYQELGELLLSNLNMRLLYFLRNGGRTRFSLINDYNFAKFTNVLHIGNELELHNEPLETFELTIRQFHHADEANRIIQRIKAGRFPLTSETMESVFALTVDANTGSQAEQARSLIGNTLGRSEFGAFARAIMYRTFVDKMPSEKKTEELEHSWQSAGQDLGSLNAFLEYCESHFGSELENIALPSSIEKYSSDDLPLRQSIREETLDVGITRIDVALTALGKKLADNARKAAQQNKISKEERDRLVTGYQNPETVLTTLLGNELPPSFAPVLNEWTSHVQSAIQTAREARTLRRDAPQIRELQLRYLDKTASLPEYLRFADSAMCCFTSKDFQGVGAQQYIARIWKDPLSFVLHIEEPSAEQTDRRNSVGFVFGSYGINRDGEPVMILNGVYMDKKTDLAARKVLETIEQALAKPLGCKEVLTASQHAGRSNYGAEYENTDREYLRLRAIKQRWNDQPEQHTYDDIGLIAVDAREGQAQDSQAVNRWAKTGAHVLRKIVS